MACAICEIRRPRRFCPGVRGDICTLCCGTSREVTVNCPLDCEYLREAHRREKPADFDFSKMPNQDIQVTEEFLAKNEELVMGLGNALAVAALHTDDVIDYDVREALDSLIRTFRTLQSGVLYESLPTNPLAANMYRLVQDAVDKFRTEETQRLGMSKTRDADVLGGLVFLQRLEFDRNNGRKLGRAFLEFLGGFYQSERGAAEPPASSLILP